MWRTFGLLGGGEHLPGLGEVHGDGLLAQHVLAGGDGGEGDGGVDDVGRGDDDGVDVGALEDVLVVGEGGGDAGLLLGAVEDGGVGVAEGDDLGMGAEGEAGEVVWQGDAPASDHGDADLVQGGSSWVREFGGRA